MVTDLKMEERIRKEISVLKEKNGIIPLFYAESGSRLWGFASKDSDYDVRGFHLPSQSQYYSFLKPEDQYEVRKGNLDLLSFSLDKAFNLLLQSNPTLLEWIRAQKIYLNKLPDFTGLKEKILENLNLKALFMHYLSLAKKNFEKYLAKDKKFTYKRSLYVLRGLLSSIYVYRFERVPPLKFRELMDRLDLTEDLKGVSESALRKKLTSTEEAEVGSRDKKPLLRAIKVLFRQLSEAEVEDTGNKELLSKELEKYSIRIKKEHYQPT